MVDGWFRAFLFESAVLRLRVLGGKPGINFPAPLVCLVLLTTGEFIESFASSLSGPDSDSDSDSDCNFNLCFESGSF